jgi:hypothetical protein
MEIAKLVLEYIKALVWPITVLALSLFFEAKLSGYLQDYERPCCQAGFRWICEKKSKRSSSYPKGSRRPLRLISGE